MYLIISGTNREDSHTEKVAAQYRLLLADKGIDAPVFSLKGLDLISNRKHFKQLETEILKPATRFIFIVPEYNGSYPGILKLMIDCSDIRNTWYYKKALLTGVATGRAGNLRGMDHLNDTLQYMRVYVHYNKLPISVVDKVMDEQGQLNADTLKAIRLQLEQFINF